jgi:hypothetical protein
VHILLRALPRLLQDLFDEWRGSATHATQLLRAAKLPRLWSREMLSAALHGLAIGPDGTRRGEEEMSSARAIVSLLIESKADLSDAAGCGSSPLTHALFSNEVEMVRVLLTCRADAEQRLPSSDSTNRAIKSVFIGPGRSACLRVLLDHGVALSRMDAKSLLVHACNADLETALMLVGHTTYASRTATAHAASSAAADSLKPPVHARMLPRLQMA